MLPSISDVSHRFFSDSTFQANSCRHSPWRFLRDQWCREPVRLVIPRRARHVALNFTVQRTEPHWGRRQAVCLGENATALHRARDSKYWLDSCQDTVRWWGVVVSSSKFNPRTPRIFALVKSGGLWRWIRGANVPLPSTRSRLTLDNAAD